MAIYSTNLTIDQPSALCASENPIIINLSTGSGTEEYAQAYFRFDKKVPIEMTITFNLINPVYSKSFISKAYPNESNHFFQSIITNSTGLTITSGITAAESAMSLAECLSNDPIISKYYSISNQGIRTYLKAKEASPKYDLTNRISLSSQPPFPNAYITLFTPTSGSSAFEGNDIFDYSLYLDVYKIDGNYAGTLTDGDKITELVLPFSSSDNIHRFDLSSICKTFVNSERIDYSVPGYTRLPKHIAVFQTQYGEIYPLFPGSNIKRKWQRGESGIFYVMNCANDYTTANDLTHLTGQTLSDKVFEVNFLSNSPAIKRTYRTQKESLAFIIPENINTSLKLFGDIEYYDGSTSNNNFLLDFNTSTSNSGGTYVANCGYEILNLESFESANKKIRYVDFYVLQTTLNSEVYSNNTFASNLNNWNTNSPGNFANWSWSAGSAVATLGTGLTNQTVTGFTFASTMEGWVNGNGLGNDWAWSSINSGSIRATTADNTGVKPLVLSGFTGPAQPFTVQVTTTATFFYESTNLKGFLKFYNSSHTEIFSEQFSTWGTFFSDELITITASSVYNNIAHMAIEVTATDFVAGDAIGIGNIQINTLSGSTLLHRTNNFTKTGLNLLSYSHVLTANVTFAGTAKLFAVLKDNIGNQIGSTIQLISGNAGTHTGSTTISAANTPDVYSTEFFISGLTGVNQSVAINELSLTSGIEANEYTKRKKFEFPYSEPDSTFQVAFLSKFGVYETFAFIGVETEDIERSSKTYTVPLAPELDGSYQEGFKTTATYQTELKRKITCNSGLLDLNHFDWLKELISSTDIYEIRSDGSINYLLLDSVKYSESNQDNQFNFEATFIQTVFENSIGL